MEWKVEPPSIIPNWIGLQSRRMKHRVSKGMVL